MPRGALATAYSNQRKLDRCQDGTLWLCYYNRDSGASNDEYINFKYSKDNGKTWSAIIGGPDVGSGASTHQLNASFFIDIDDFAHLVYKNAIDGFIYYRRGTPNAGRTAWTWSAASLVVGNAGYNYPDVVAHREGTGWVAHYVSTYNDSTPYNIAEYRKITITSGGAITVSGQTVIGGSYAVNQPCWPSIDFHHTGDGKTVKDGAPHLFVAWSAGTTGTGKGIRFKKATYSGGVWTWGTEREFDTDRYIHSSVNGYWLNCVFDGIRAIVCGLLWKPSTSTVERIVWSRNVADTAFNFHSTTSVASSGRVMWGSASYDGTWVYLIGATDSPRKIWAFKVKLSDNTSNSEDPLIEGILPDAIPYLSAKRGNSQFRIEWVYIHGNNSPYAVKYDVIVTNVAPNTPTALQRTGVETDATPNFSANVTDPNSGQQIKARFEIYQNDEVTLVGTVDSAFRSGDGAVTAEYSTTLPVGSYKLRAKAIDDLGLESAYTSFVAFDVTANVDPIDTQYLWNANEVTILDTQYLWDIAVDNVKDLEFKWDVTEIVTKDHNINWNVNTPWEDVVESRTDIWERVY